MTGKKIPVYQATIVQTNTNTADIFTGINKNTFKTRYIQRTLSFRISHRKSNTTLSGHIWDLSKRKQRRLQIIMGNERKKDGILNNNNKEQLVPSGEIFYTFNEAYFEQKNGNYVDVHA
ncbi:hypothetical protein ElyMa_005847700 [Elysia marginata]|uniref:Uncharacterized protein n=1 Tax=Elysia marginata TaxID=1093978 RepID=A0AAV4FYF2_9GAST|nr:hypothetical protein ElyMa_005847700 [Elysia marginata]